MVLDSGTDYSTHIQPCRNQLLSGLHGSFAFLLYTVLAFNYYHCKNQHEFAFSISNSQHVDTEKYFPNLFFFCTYQNKLLYCISDT